MKRLGENTKERRIILGTNAVLADVFLDIRLDPISNFPILKYPYKKNPSKELKLWGKGGLGEVENIRGRENFLGLALKGIPALTYKSSLSAPISEWGEKRVR